jgi:hypothetical protein
VLLLGVLIIEYSEYSGILRASPPYDKMVKVESSLSKSSFHSQERGRVQFLVLDKHV